MTAGMLAKSMLAKAAASAPAAAPAAPHERAIDHYFATAVDQPVHVPWHMGEAVAVDQAANVPWHMGDRRPLNRYFAAVSGLPDERAHAHALATGKSAHAVGVIHAADGLWYSFAFNSLDDADDWFGKAISEPTAYTYAAYFDKDAAGLAYTANESISRHRGRA